jgi:hypothetical protein
MTVAARFRQSDVTRVFKGAEKAGVQLSRVEICPVTGRIIAFTGTPVPANDAGGDNPWDVVLPT